LADITEAEFKLNKSNYYYISKVQIEPVPIATIKPQIDEVYYRTTDHEEVKYTG